MASLTSSFVAPGSIPVMTDRVAGAAPPTAARPGQRLRQPALASPVMLAFAERLSLALGDAEIKLLHVLVLAQRLGVAIEHHTAVFQHVAVSRVFQRHAGILLREQERNSFLDIEVADDLENLLHELR